MLDEGVQVIRALWVQAPANFAGLVSDVPFDMVRLSNPATSVAIVDNLYFGPPIPAAGTLALLAMAGLGGVVRRRS